LVLLSGPPGTGKTLMTEASKYEDRSVQTLLLICSVAEKAKRPLYYVDARDLGSHIIEIGTNFRLIMANAAEWNAIVLLDGMIPSSACQTASDECRIGYLSTATITFRLRRE
jgi:hypothetical protein